MNQLSKTAFTSMFLNALDGRNPAIFIEQLTGEDCVEGHNILRALDIRLKDRWTATGAPTGEGFHDKHPLTYH